MLVSVNAAESMDAMPGGRASLVVAAGDWPGC